ncbi:MAG: isoprenylcysteine carboxylmethyltransferase family protein [bacterium]
MEPTQKKPKSVHIILSESYLTFIVLFIPAMLLDTYFNTNKTVHPNLVILGWVLLFISPVLIYWAQKTSAAFKKAYENGTPITPSFFMHGPYRVTRRPTHLGITLMFVGFSLVISSPFALVSALIAHLVTQMNFIKREECILLEKYGEPYQVYCNKVGKWL